MNISILNVGFLEAFHETTFAAIGLLKTEAPSNLPPSGGKLDVLKISDCIFVCLSEAAGLMLLLFVCLFLFFFTGGCAF